MSDDESEDVGYQVVFEGDDAPSKLLSRDGKATATFPNGDVYEGEYRDGKRHGQGKYTFKKGGVYEGQYEDNKKEGQGVFTAPDGGKYSGHFKADLRHGQGKYEYVNGDVYEGEWRAGRKHGPGTYTYAATATKTVGEWSSGQCLSGTLLAQDGTQYVGTFQNNSPAGEGMFAYPSGNIAGGRFAGDKSWQRDAFRKPLPNTVPPDAVKADPERRAQRLIEKAVLKVDICEDADRLGKKVAGAPNWRELGGGQHVFVCGQPTTDGVKAAVEGMGELELEKTVWVNVRATPVVYVNNASYAPRLRKALHAPLLVPDVDTARMQGLEAQLVAKVKADSGARGNSISYYQDTYAVVPSERQNLELTTAVVPAEDEEQEVIRTVAQTYAALAEEGAEAQLVRLAQVSEANPSLVDLSGLVEGVKESIPETTAAVVVNDQLGGQRATFAALAVALARKAATAPAEGEGGDEGDEEAAEEEPAAEEEEAKEGGDEGDEGDEGDDKKEEGDGEAEAAAEEEAAEEEEQPEPEPDFKDKAEYAIIRELVKALPEGEKLKEGVDALVDGADQLGHLRNGIWEAKEQHANAGTDEEKAYWHGRAVAALERYFTLIAFNAYATEVAKKEFTPNYADWSKTNLHLFEILGSRTDKQLAQFNWE